MPLRSTRSATLLLASTLTLLAREPLAAQIPAQLPAQAPSRSPAQGPAQGAAQVETVQAAPEAAGSAQASGNAPATEAPRAAAAKGSGQVDPQVRFQLATEGLKLVWRSQDGALVQVEWKDEAGYWTKFFPEAARDKVAIAAADGFFNRAIFNDSIGLKAADF